MLKETIYDLNTFEIIKRYAIHDDYVNRIVRVWRDGYLETFNDDGGHLHGHISDVSSGSYDKDTRIYPSISKTKWTLVSQGRNTDTETELEDTYFMDRW